MSFREYWQSCICDVKHFWLHMGISVAFAISRRLYRVFLIVWIGYTPFCDEGQSSTGNEVTQINELVFPFTNLCF